MATHKMTPKAFREYVKKSLINEVLAPGQKPVQQPAQTPAMSADAQRLNKVLQSPVGKTAAQAIDTPQELVDSFTNLIGSLQTKFPLTDPSNKAKIINAFNSAIKKSSQPAAPKPTA